MDLSRAVLQIRAYGQTCTLPATASTTYVLVQFHPDKLQFVTEDGRTMTLTRRSAAVEIENFVDYMSRNVMYTGEIWKISHAYPAQCSYVRAKYEGVWDTQLAPLEKDTVSADAQTVYSMALPDAQDGVLPYQNTAAKLIVRTSCDITGIQLVTATGATLTYKSGYTDTAGVRIWTVERKFGIGSYHYALRIKSAANGWSDSDKVLNFTVKRVSTPAG